MAIIQELESYVQSYPAGMETVTDVSLSQNENGRQLRFKIIGVTIPAGSVATISGTKPDGAVYSKEGTIEDSDTVIFDEDVQMTAVFGTWYAKIRIFNSGNTIASARVRFIIDKDPVDAGSVPSDSQLDGIIAEMEAYVEEARSVAYGSPLTASTAAAMTDQTKVYVYTGTETGYTAGHWYFWNGTEWHDGGVYNAVAVQTDKTLSVADKAADGKATGEALEHRIPVYSEDSYTSDSTPYLYRQTGGGVAVGTRELGEIVGGSVAWNQLVQSLRTGSSTSYGVTCVKNDDGTYTLNGTTNSANAFFNIDVVENVNYLKEGHVYFLTKGSNDSRKIGIGLAAGSMISSYTDPKNELLKITSAQASAATSWARIQISEPIGTVLSNVVVYPQLYDITQMFGSTIADYIYGLETATAGAGVAKLKEWGFFAEDYYAYDAGSLQSVTGVSAHIMRDSDDNIISNYPLDSSLTLRGIPKLDSNSKLYYDGDTYTSDGTVTRKYGIVDLGTLSWNLNEGQTNRFYAALSGLKLADLRSIAFMCGRYLSNIGGGAYDDKTVYNAGNTAAIYVVDGSYSSAATFKTAMSGVFLVYPLATPTTEQADPYASVQICAEGGTEEYVTTGIVPVGHNTRYPADLAGKLDSIPALPTTAGNYRLKVTVTGGVPSYEWVSA